VGELLELVALADAGDRRLKGFSGGMRRRVGIAQALLDDPKLLIVDEPTAGLDPEERIRFRTLPSRLPGSRTVLLSTHIVEDVAQTCRQVAILGQGRVRFRGLVDEVVAHPRSRVWTVDTPDTPPPGVVMSAVTHEHGTRYRVVADVKPAVEAEPVEPSLEDGYIALTGATATPSSAPGVIPSWLATRWGGGVPQHQRGGQGDRLRRQVRVRETVQQHPRGLRADLVVRHTDRAQRGRQPVDERHVVVPHQADVVRTPQPAFAEHVQAPQGDQVVGRDDRRRPTATAQQRTRRLRALDLRETLGDRDHRGIGGDPGVLKGLSEGA
jgi:energy-coupling factor transporter ATP-binding protein EcfA2